MVWNLSLIAPSMTGVFTIGILTPSLRFTIIIEAIESMKNNVNVVLPTFDNFRADKFAVFLWLKKNSWGMNCFSEAKLTWFRSNMLLQLLILLWQCVYLSVLDRSRLCRNSISSSSEIVSSLNLGIRISITLPRKVYLILIIIIR